MPGKHAPPTSKSFLLSVATAAGGALAAIGLVVGVVLVAVNSGGGKGAGNPVVSGSPTPQAARTATPTSPSPSPTTASEGIPVLPRTRVTLAVLNGTTRTGLARAFRTRATGVGYPVIRVANAVPHAKSTIYYRSDAVDEALEFQRTFREFTEVLPAPPSLSSDVLLTIILGADYP